MSRKFTYIEIKPDELVHTDLREEAKYGGSVYRITVYDETGIQPAAEAAEAFLNHGRLGIAWGADATWADVPSLDVGIDMWLNHPEEWEAAN